MSILLKLIQSISKYRQNRKIKKLRGKPNRSLYRFKEKYPQYTIGTPCYDVPNIKHQHNEAVLKIGKYCSIAKNVQIFIGGIHRTDWITTYPFPAFEEKAANIPNYSISRGDVIIGSDVWLCENCTIYFQVLR